MKNVITEKLIAFIICALMVLPALAETKTVERSSKKAPEWVGGAVDGFLIVSVRNQTLAGAQDEALQKITESIISSIASNVSVKQQNVMSEVVHNGVIESTDSFNRNTAINAANLPYLKDISLAKAADIYWERKRDKKTKEEFYDYAVKYPYSRSERAKLISEFEELDAQKEEELKELENGYATVASSEAVNQAIAKLEALQKYFFDPMRSEQVRTLRMRYKEIGKNVTAYGHFTAPGVLECGLELNGYRFMVPTIKNVKSNCARILSTTKDEGVFRIEFDSSDCLPDEINSIQVDFRVGDHRISQSFEIPATCTGNATDRNARLQIKPKGKIHLSADSTSAENRTVSDINIRLTVDNGGEKFGVKAIELNVPELSNELVLDNIDKIYTTPGMVQIIVIAKGTFRVSGKRSSNTRFITGAITVANPENGKIERIRLTLPYSTNWNK